MSSSPLTFLRKTSIRTVLAASVIGAGAGVYGVSALAPAHAEAVKVEAPAAPGFADIVEAVSPAVVSVRVRANVAAVTDRDFDFGGRGFDGLPESHPFRRFFREFERGPRRGDRRSERPRHRRPTSQGSGFFISEDGFLVTNNHVVENGSEFTIIMHDGSELEARLVGTDPRTDLAVLKVDEEREFTYVAFDEGNDARVGDWVVAVGNPFGLGGTVTAGIVSARGRDIGAGPYDDFLQIDAAVNRGNSGGPTFNLSGEVVGVNTAIFSPSGGNVGIAFAVPASVAADVVAELMDDGNVERGWLGIRIQPVTSDIAESLGLEGTDGAIIADAEAGTPAEEAGLRPGDVIVQVDDLAIEGPRELSKAIAAFEPGTEVDVVIKRNGRDRTISVELGELPGEVASLTPSSEEPAGQETAMLELGLTVTASDEGPGVLITDVEPGSTAADAGLRVGDIVLEINNAPVSDGDQFNQVLEEVEQTGRKAALLRIETGDSSRFVALPLAG